MIRNMFSYTQAIFTFGLVCATTMQPYQLSSEQKKAFMRDHPKKLVGLVPARNESAYIDQCLRALALYTDAIVVLDDASTDNTVAIVETLAKECHIERIIKKTVWFRDEPGDRNKLLQAGREIGGTHFIMVDADEMLTAQCLKDNFLRNKILALEPGDTMDLSLIRLWKSTSKIQLEKDKNQRPVFKMKYLIFCDDGQCTYRSEFIHTLRIPCNLTPGKDIELTPAKTYGLLHFYAVNWRTLLIKQAWYRCLDHIRNPDKSIDSINKRHACEENDDDPRYYSNADPAWFDYPFFDQRAYETPRLWREQQVLEWFSQYGKKFFAGLDIWDIDWGAGLPGANPLNVP